MKETVCDLLDYISWRGDLSFEQSPFCAIDALILAQLSYINFDGLLKDDFSYRKRIFELYSIFTKDSAYASRCEMGAVINPKTPELLKAVAFSNRFAYMEITGYEAVLDEEKEEQFAGMTFIIDKSTIAVVFRGTDDNLVGWKEDFNIVLQNTIPSQESGLAYLNKAAGAFKHSDIIVSGHSKGACVAVYSGVYCELKAKKRINAVYNFDGPGFAEEFFERPEYLQMENKIHSFYPYFSVVGMVFQHPKSYKIIDSSAFTLFQHDAFSWNVMGNDFIYCDDFAEESKLFHQSFNEWMDSLSLEDRKRFINVFFDVVYASGAKTNLEIENNKLQASAKMLAAFHALELDDKKHITNMLRMLFKTGRDNIPMFTAFKPEINLKANIGEAIERFRDK